MARRPCRFCGFDRRKTGTTLLECGRKESLVSTCEGCGRELYREVRKARGRSETVRWELFEGWSAELAWWLGVFYGDGNIFSSGNTHRVGIVGSPSTAQRWLDLVAPGKTPKRLHGGATKAVQAYKDSKHLVLLMESQFGFPPGPKTFNLHWPESIPEKYLQPFIRGLWDADGTVYVERRREHKGNDTIGMSYASSSIPFLARLRDTLVDQLGIGEVSLTLSNPGSSARMIGWRGQPASLIADWLYGEAPEHIRNEDRMEAYRHARAVWVEGAFQKCACGESASLDGMCYECYWEARSKTHSRTGPHLECKECGKRGVEARGLCVACYKRLRRRELKEREAHTPKPAESVEASKSAPKKRARRSKRGGVSSAERSCGECGNKGVEARGLCKACYHRDRRARQKAKKAASTSKSMVETPASLERPSRGQGALGEKKEDPNS